LPGFSRTRMRKAPHWTSSVNDPCFCHEVAYLLANHCTLAHTCTLCMWIPERGASGSRRPAAARPARWTSTAPRAGADGFSRTCRSAGSSSTPCTLRGALLGAPLHTAASRQPPAPEYDIIIRSAPHQCVFLLSLFLFSSFFSLSFFSFLHSSYVGGLLSVFRTAPVPMQPVSMPGATAAAASDPAAAKDDTPATLIKAGGGS
jgi:hypothetical protein